MAKRILIIILIAILTSCNNTPTEEAPSPAPTGGTSMVGVADVYSNAYASLGLEADQGARKMDYVITAERMVALTFEALGTNEQVTAILDALDECGLKATFFLPGVRVAEEPEIAAKIVERGHDIGNNTLSRSDISIMPQDRQEKEIQRSHEVIEQELGVAPKWLRINGEVTDSVRHIAKECGYDTIVGTSINPKDWSDISAEEIARGVFENKRGGGIINLTTNNDNAPGAIPIMNRLLNEAGYWIIPLPDLLGIHNQKKHFSEIEGGNVFSVNPDYENAPPYNLIYRAVPNDPAVKKIALTFDDWAGEAYTNEILDILDRHNIKVTFFIRGIGAITNPSLLCHMEARGHEIANHTYTHSVLPNLPLSQVQKELITCHQVMTQIMQKPPALYLRPPTGGVNDEVAAAISAAGCEYILMYDVSPLDWDLTLTTEDIYNASISKIVNGSILTLHILDDLKTPDALDDILNTLKEQGYQVSTISELLKDSTYMRMNPSDTLGQTE